MRQLDRELAVVQDLEYDGYFLTMYEIVRFCRERGILCQGRGSAANSAVCYCLGITAIDPVQMDLLFERFLSRERAEPPDIDLDIEHTRREEVIQHVYDKYGRSHAAMVANFIRFRARSAIREVGKVLGVPETSLDRVARMASNHGTLSDESLAELQDGAPLHPLLLDLCMQIQGMPRHLSIHPGGFLPTVFECASDCRRRPSLPVYQHRNDGCPSPGWSTVEHKVSLPTKVHRRTCRVRSSEYQRRREPVLRSRSLESWLHLSVQVDGPTIVCRFPHRSN